MLLLAASIAPRGGACCRVGDSTAFTPPGSSPSRAACASSRDALNARQVALKAAVAYCSAREAAKAGDILPLAASFEAWLTRPLGEA
jgi:hypothetical protein